MQSPSAELPILVKTNSGELDFAIIQLELQFIQHLYDESVKIFHEAQN